MISDKEQLKEISEIKKKSNILKLIFLESESQSSPTE